MPKIRVVTTITLPAGTASFADSTPALKTAYLAKVAEGKVEHLPQSSVNHSNGWVTTTTTNIWNTRSDYEEFVNFFETNYRMLQEEYYHPIHTARPTGVITAHPVRTITEE
jgi:hypothetical protein